MKYTAVIIEDELPAKVTLTSYIKRYCRDIEVIASFETVAESVAYLNQNQVDILFVDVQLRDGLGLDVLNQIESENYKIIFTTAFEKYAIDAIKYRSFGYLLKPLDPLEFKEIIRRVLKDLDDGSKREEQKRIKVPIANGYQWIDVMSIIRCSSESNYTKIIVKNVSSPIVIARTLKSVEEDMINSDSFFRVHKSHLINLAHIKDTEIQNNLVKMINDDEVPVARTKRNLLFERLEN